MFLENAVLCEGDKEGLVCKRRPKIQLKFVEKKGNLTLIVVPDVTKIF